jgi:hypothetical protein
MSVGSDRQSHAFTLLRAANPVDAEEIRRELDEEQLRALRAQIAALETTGSSPRVPRVRLASAVGLAAAAVTVGALVALFQDGSEPASAFGVLKAAASVAAREPATAPGPGEYTYVKQRSGVVGGPAQTVEWWIASDGSGRMRRSGPQAIYVWSSEDEKRRVLPAKTAGRNRATRDVTFGAAGFPEVYAKVNPGLLDGRVEELPTDPESLERVLRLKLEGAVDFNPDPSAQSLQLLQVIEEVLANPLASPRLRSAAYESAARIDGVEIRENTADPIGRPATAIAFCSAVIPARYEVFFDPATSATLGTREVSPVDCADTRSYAAGLMGYNVYLETGTVDSIHQRP